MQCKFCKERMREIEPDLYACSCGALYDDDNDSWEIEQFEY